MPSMKSKQSAVTTVMTKSAVPIFTIVCPASLAQSKAPNWFQALFRITVSVTLAASSALSLACSRISISSFNLISVIGSLSLSNRRRIASRLTSSASCSRRAISTQ